MQCPTCRENLATEQGMRQHHTKVHGEHLPNRCCKGCNTRFYDPKARRKYCDDCDPNAGSENGNWKGGKSESTCKSCNSLFSYYPSEKEGVYCPDCIDSADGLLPENPQEEYPRVDVECQYCHQELSVLPSELEKHKRGFFCDLGCYGEWLSENVVGSDHHQWKGGQITYGRSWWSIRRAARKRDEYTYQNCGQDKSDIGRNPDVHHLIPVREFDRAEEAHTLDNVVTLCRSCHRRVEEGKITLKGEGKK